MYYHFTFICFRFNSFLFSSFAGVVLISLIIFLNKRLFFLLPALLFSLMQIIL